MLQNTVTGQQQTGLNPVSKVLPVLGVQRIGSSTQEQHSNANNFILGQVYQAKVQSAVNKHTHLVEVDQQLLKMQLGEGVKAGQTLALRFIKTAPVPTFLLDQQAHSADPNTKLSQAGQTIARLLKQAQQQGVSERYQAQAVVSQQPLLVAETAKSLKQAIGKTGLFYESHLQALASGEHDLESLKQEPQNMQKQLLPTLVSQQLSLLESQKLAWSGEIWPGQQMQLDIAPVQEDHKDEDGTPQTEDSDFPIESLLQLDFPTLGKVNVKLVLHGEQLSVQLKAAQTSTQEVMQARTTHLQKSLSAHVKQVEALSVSALEDKDEETINTGFRPVTPG